MPSNSFATLAGPENGPAIVFSHALGGDISMWDRQVDSFAGGYRVLRYDLRGHGRSPDGWSSLRIEDLGRDVLELLDQHGIERAHFCGLSLGGLIAQWLGSHAGERLLSLTLVDAAPQMGAPDVWNQRLAQIEASGMSAIVSATMERWFTPSFREKDPETVGRIRAVFETTSPAGYMACAKVVRDTSITAEELRSISTRTLVVTGSFDAAASPEQCRKMAAQIAGSRYLELNAAHISPVEASNEFNNGLQAFLREL